MELSSALDSKKRPAEPRNASVCSFCEAVPAAVMVQLPSTRKRGQEPRPYCLLHYYTTRAVRTSSNKVTLIEEEVQHQLDGVQPLFAQAFTELQQELSEESARAFTAHQSDPLAVLHDLRGKPKRRPKKIPQKAAPKDGGGFLRTVNIPERLLQTQQQQQDLQTQQLQQIKNMSSEGNPYKRRKATRKSIWNLAMQPEAVKAAAAATASAAASERASEVTCSCGSTKVSNAGNVTQRNTELTKGETWGNKDRGDALVLKYQCNQCGKVWNEEE